MVMNKNTIIFNDFALEIPKISTDQYILLRKVMKSIEEKNDSNNSYFIASNTFPNLSANEIKELLKRNVKFSLTDMKNNEWYATDIISEIKVFEDKIFFRPAHILYEIVYMAKNSPKHIYLKYILFSGIRYKQTLLFLDYLSKNQKDSFALDLNELKSILEFNQSQYSNFSTFRTSVIERITKEINAKTTYDLKFNTSKRKNGKKVISIEFNISSKEISNV